MFTLPLSRRSVLQQGTLGEVYPTRAIGINERRAIFSVNLNVLFDISIYINTRSRLFLVKYRSELIRLGIVLLLITLFFWCMLFKSVNLMHVYACLMIIPSESNIHVYMYKKSHQITSLQTYNNSQRLFENHFFNSGLLICLFQHAYC